MLCDEISKPFADNIHRVFTPHDLLFLLCDESPSRIRAGMLLSGTISKILTSDMMVRLECDIEIEVNITDVLEKDQEKKFSLRDLYFEGMIVKTRLKQVNFQVKEATLEQVHDIQKLIKIEISLKESEVNAHQHYTAELYSKVKHLKIDSSDYPKPIKYYQRSSSFKPRMISHPLFQNITEEESRGLLASQSDGSVINFITLKSHIVSVSLGLILEKT